MKLLVTGARGATGAYVREVFPDDELTLTDSDTLDITDPRSVASGLRAARAEAVLHLAAETDVDRCEREPSHAFRVNALGTENVALACREARAVLVYASTGAVFGARAKAEAFTEYDEPAPVNVYAQAKFAGEEAVRALVPDHYIVRAGWMIGGGRRDRKFVYKMLKLMASRKEVAAVADKRGTLSYAREFLQQVKRYLESGRPGTYHAASAGVVTRYDVAVELARLAGQTTRVLPCGSDAFPLPAPRPESEAIANFKAGLLGLDVMRPWQEALAAYVQELRDVGVLVGGEVREVSP